MNPAPPVAWNGARVRGLTLIRPWDRALLLGPKDVENRPRRWNLPADGILVAVHAGHAWDGFGWDRIRALWPDAARLPGADGAEKAAGGRGFVAGAIVGLVQLWPSGEPAAWASPWATGPRCYPVGRKVPLEKSIPHQGMLGLWRVPPALEDQLVRLWVAAGHPAPVLSVTPPTEDDGGDLFEGL